MIENMLEYSWKTLKHLQLLKSNKFISFMCQVHQIINKLGKLRYLFVTLKKKSRTNEETNKQNNKKQCSKHEYIRTFLICALLGHQLEDDTIFQKCVLCLIWRDRRFRHKLIFSWSPIDFAYLWTANCSTKREDR